ncbi:uncharacterized protein LOC143910874 isoform X2 [Arctopsyche grandis]|uniref:uncharacterized protein LOC143910874 isoform X2 n=1 Tax=Arctopsyche grandis TaxID=121162 RepID=UPI00406D9B04
MSDKILLSSKICPFDELTCFVCTIDEHEKRDKSAPSVFHHRILKCRILIFSMQEILSAPNHKNNLQIYVIFQRSTNINETLQECLNKNKLRVLQSAEVNANIFEACLKYTLIAKMAPLWNQIETNLLVKGRDFLQTRQPLKAIILNVFVFDNSVILEIKCLKIRLSPIQIDDLNVANNTLDYFNQMPNAIISENSLMNQWVHVLPSLKKGQIISVNKELPQSALFQNYKDLNRHWKNILYTYPSVCLQTSKPLQIVPTADTIRIIKNDFLFDIRQRLSHVLGYSTNFDYFNDPDTFGHNPTSLHDFSCFKKENFMNQNDSSMENIESNIDNNFTQQISLCTPTQIIPKKPTFFPKNNNDIYNSEKHDSDLENIESSVDDSVAQHISSCMATQNISNNTIFKPIFFPKKNNGNYDSQKNCMKQNEFQDLEHSIQTNMDVECSQNQTASFQNIHFSTPIFIKQDITNVKIDQHIFSINGNNDLSVTSLNALQNNLEKDHLPQDIPLPLNEIKNKFTKSDKSDFNDSIAFSNNNSQDKAKSQDVLKMVSQSTANTKIKKPKSKNINNMVNIALLANTDPKGLQKLNIPTLYTWLRSQNVHVTTKMLKQQLLDKVFEHLNMKSE